MTKRTRWIASLSVVAGTIMALASFLTTGQIAAALLEVGVTLGLAAVLVWFEQQLTQQVTERINDSETHQADQLRKSEARQADQLQEVERRLDEKLTDATRHVAEGIAASANAEVADLARSFREDPTPAGLVALTQAAQALGVNSPIAEVPLSDDWKLNTLAHEQQRGKPKVQFTIVRTVRPSRSNPTPYRTSWTDQLYSVMLDNLWRQWLRADNSPDLATFKRIDWPERMVAGYVQAVADKLSPSSTEP